MPYQNDMMSLADIVGPAYAAQQSGIQNDVANAEAQTKLDILKQQAPALAAQPGLENVFKQAQTGYEQGLGMQSQAKGLESMATLPSGISAGIAGNQAKMTGDQVAKLGNLGQMVGQIAGVLDSVPQAARPAAMQQILQSNNIDPQQVGPLISGDPDMLRAVSQKMIQASSGFQTQMALEQQRGTNQAAVAGIQSGGRVQAAEISAEARRYASDQQRAVKEMSRNIDQQIAALTTRIGSPQEQPGDKERLKFLGDQQIQLRNMQALTTRALLGMGGLPEGQPPAAPTLNIPQQGGGASPMGFSQSDIEEAMRRRGLLK